MTFPKEISDVFAETGLYNNLLFFFEYHPFHNILHAKVSEIFCTALDKNCEKTIDFLLYNTNLIKNLLEISKEKHDLVFTSGKKSTRGYMCFVRKIANKLSEMQKKNDEVQNCLESIPEWGDYYEQNLKVKN